MSRRVLHPTDFSKASNAALARSLAEARANRGELVLVHVLSPVIPMTGAGEAYVTPSVYEQMNVAARVAAMAPCSVLTVRGRA
jgi:nucleotide-binding universal stress UspA family protein